MLTSLEEKSLEGYKAIVACPSVGNVGQLAVDLLIASLKAERAGSVWDEGVLPFVGADPFSSDPTPISTPNDIYTSEQHRLLLLQNRSAVRKAAQKSYVEALVAFFKERRVDEVIVISGMFSHGRDDQELLQGRLRYMACPKSEASYKDKVGALNWIRMKGNDLQGESPFPVISGSGFTRSLFKIAAREGLSCFGMLYYCMEGDNVQDGIDLFARVNDLLQILPPGSRLSTPPSWKYLFGGGTPKGLF